MLSVSMKLFLFSVVFSQVLLHIMMESFYNRTMPRNLFSNKLEFCSIPGNLSLFIVPLPNVLVTKMSVFKLRHLRTISFFLFHYVL